MKSGRPLLLTLSSPEVERKAATLFDTYRGETGLTEEILTRVNSIETLAKAQGAGHLWVAVASMRDIRDVVGFALVLELGGYAHLEELDVLPPHGQRGLGSALPDAVCSWAGAAGYPAVSVAETEVMAESCERQH